MTEGYSSSSLLAMKAKYYCSKAAAVRSFITLVGRSLCGVKGKIATAHKLYFIKLVFTVHDV